MGVGDPDLRAVPLDDVNIGPPKTVADLILSPITGKGSEFDIARKSQTDIDAAGGGVLIGDEKSFADLILADKRDDLGNLILNKVTRENPKATEKILGQRASTEALLGVNQGDLSIQDTGFEDIFSQGEIGTVQRRAILLAIEEDPNAFDNTVVFQDISEFELTASQMVRFNELVDTGALDADIFASSREQTPGLSPVAGLGSLSKLEQPTAGITQQQAIYILMGNERDAFSKFDPTTGFTYTNDAIARATQYSKSYSIYQGFPEISFRDAGHQLYPQTPGLKFQGFAPGEAPLDIRGDPKIISRNDRLRGSLTLEEMIRVNELMFGRSRRVDNPRIDYNQFGDTLLEGNFAL